MSAAAELLGHRAAIELAAAAEADLEAAAVCSTRITATSVPPTESVRLMMSSLSEGRAPVAAKSDSSIQV